MILYSGYQLYLHLGCYINEVYSLIKTLAEEQRLLLDEFYLCSYLNLVLWENNTTTYHYHYFYKSLFRGNWMYMYVYSLIKEGYRFLKCSWKIHPHRM